MYFLNYGKTTVGFQLPDGHTADRIQYKETSIAHQSDSIKEALDHPVASAKLSELAKGKNRAVILISDRSRLCPSFRFLGALLEQLNTAGLRDEQIKVIVALGMHRHQTTSELKELVGETVFQRVKVVNHSALSQDCSFLGVTSRGTPVEINRTVAEADLRIATGNIEPHRLVGVSGGVKALVPGVASERSIEANHALSQHYHAVPGIADNPLHQDLIEAHDFAPIHFLFNVIVNHKRDILAAVAGDIIQAHRVGAQYMQEHFFVQPQKTYDVVIASTGGSPKDSQLYQAIKTMQNASALTKPGGKIVVLAQCEEMFGNGLLQLWVETIQDRSIIMQRLKDKFVLGPHKIAAVDHILKSHEVFLYSNMPPALVELIGFRPVAELQPIIDELLSSPTVQTAVVPYGALTFPQF